ncbi:unnamed protein product [Pleuronectes platessa]|uniref:Uncharacterized protein n=1 Tax=Pleuronectes platessa TaxID=8262 RepID=A0A9N7UFB0_PLEPL|nr:unnamed protein product [Pleuronectes platessa]
MRRKPLNAIDRLVVLKDTARLRGHRYWVDPWVHTTPTPPCTKQLLPFTPLLPGLKSQKSAPKTKPRWTLDTQCDTDKD